MGFGRFISVLLPLGLTLASLICILSVCLAGITSSSLNMLEVSTANFSASSSSFDNLANEIIARDIGFPDFSSLLPPNLLPKVEAAAGLSGENFTAKTLGLADKYKVYLWNYCRIVGAESNCTDAKLNWAAEALDSKIIEQNTLASVGTNIALPEEMKAALKSFVFVSKLTQLLYISALVSGGTEFIFGIFAIFSRAGSCLTLLVSGIATLTILISSIVATVQTTVVTAALKGTAKAFGVESKINVQFLATTYLAVAFSVGAGVFWSLTSCCCAAGSSRSRNSGGNKGPDTEKYGSNTPYSRMNDS
ncbi:putative integral membrane protein [Golovinomyces cichoracearum]|uniref:Putative integral membrane protein n=1 Tax=Golovinomyces cichoracearum TaxID=62708 RepID=A0A420HDX6_9PEZI|nr:putative integral membrane protein [Golovinomyces cichoracearum]